MATAGDAFMRMFTNARPGGGGAGSGEIARLRAELREFENLKNEAQPYKMHFKKNSTTGMPTESKISFLLEVMHPYVSDDMAETETDFAKRVLAKYFGEIASSIRKDQVQNWQDEVDALDANITTLQAQVLAATSTPPATGGLDPTVLLGKVTQLTADLNTAKASLQTAAADLAAREAELLKVTGERDAANTAKALETGLKEKAERERANMEAEKDAIKTSKEAAEKAIIKLQAEITAEKAKVLAAEAQVASLTSPATPGATVTDPKIEIAQLQKEKSTLAADLILRDGQLTAAQLDVTTKTAELAICDGEKQALSAEKTMLEGEVSRLQGELAAAEQKFTAKEAELTACKASEQSLAQQKAQLATQDAALTIQVTEAAADKQALEAKMNELKTQHDADMLTLSGELSASKSEHKAADKLVGELRAKKLELTQQHEQAIKAKDAAQIAIAEDLAKCKADLKLCEEARALHAEQMVAKEAEMEVLREAHTAAMDALTLTYTEETTKLTSQKAAELQAVEAANKVTTKAMQEELGTKQATLLSTKEELEKTRRELRKLQNAANPTGGGSSSSSSEDEGDSSGASSPVPALPPPPAGPIITPGSGSGSLVPASPPLSATPLPPGPGSGSSTLVSTTLPPPPPVTGDATGNASGVPPATPLPLGSGLGSPVLIGDASGPPTTALPYINFTTLQPLHKEFYDKFKPAADQTWDKQNIEESQQTKKFNDFVDDLITRSNQNGPDYKQLRDDIKTYFNSEAQVNVEDYAIWKIYDNKVSSTKENTTKRLELLRIIPSATPSSMRLQL